MILIAMLNHVLGCSFYLVGSLEQDRGWPVRDGFDESDVPYRYLTSLHWSLTNFQGTMDVFPGTTNERAFAVVPLYTGLVIVSYYISTITHIMSQIQKYDQRRCC